LLIKKGKKKNLSCITSKFKLPLTA